MGLIKSNSQSDTNDDITLTKIEYQKLFEILKRSTIIGEDIQVTYSLILKLQQQYADKYGL